MSLRDDIIEAAAEIEQLRRKLSEAERRFDALLCTAGMSPRKADDGVAAEREPEATPEGRKVLPRAPSAHEVIFCDLIEKNPNAGYDEVIAALYGPRTAQTHGAARTFVGKLRARGIVTGPPGHWKIVKKP